MRRRIHLKRKLSYIHTPMKKGNIIAFVLVMIIIVIMLVFQFLNKKATPIFMNYAEMEAQKFASAIVNKAVAKDISNISIDELFMISKDTNGEISSIDFNPLVVNKALASITDSIQKNLRYIEQGVLDKVEVPEDFFLNYNQEKLKKGVFYEIPFGIVLGNTFFNNLGPKIPVRLDLIGEIFSNVKTNITNYGINNALIEVSIHIEVNQQLILPFASKTSKFTTNVPVALKLMQGTVPKYYMNGMSQNSPIFSIPME